MFVVEVTAALVTLVFLADLTGITTATTGEVGRSLGFELQIAVWLWFTVYFATYAEALAEARGKAQAASLRKTRSEPVAARQRADGTLAVGHGLRARLAQGRCLGLASGLGEGLRVRREVDREPEPDRDLKLEAQRPPDLTRGRGRDPRQVRQEDQRDEGGGHLHDEHDRVAVELTRVELAEGRTEGGPQEHRIEDAARSPGGARGSGTCLALDALDAAGAATRVDDRAGEARPEARGVNWIDHLRTPGLRPS